MNRARRKVFLLASIGGLLILLSVAPGCCRKCVGTREKATPTDNTAGRELPGVSVTGEVPHSTETIPEIKDREATHPLPARGDTAIHSHRIPRAGNDNGTSTPPGRGQPGK